MLPPDQNFQKCFEKPNNFQTSKIVHRNVEYQISKYQPKFCLWPNFKMLPTILPNKFAKKFARSYVPSS